MSKSLVALLFVVAIVAASSDSLAPLRKVIASDECTMTRMDALKPKLEVQLQLLQEVPSLSIVEQEQPPG